LDVAGHMFRKSREQINVFRLKERSIMAHVPKYCKVKNDILANIRSGIYQSNGRIPTREELVKQYSVTRTTINQALKDLVSSGILATSKRGGTVVTGKKIRLKTAIVSSGLIPVVNYSPLDYEGNAMWSILLAQDHDYNFDFIEEQKLRQDLTLIENYDCVVVIQPDVVLLNRLSEYKDRVLLVNRYMDELNFISTNHRQAVCELTKYNIKQAGSDCQIFFLSPPRLDFVVQERREGFVDACAAKGLFYRICNIPGNEYNDILHALLKLPFEKNKKIVLTSPVLSFTGAVIKMAAERGLVFNKNLFYSDFDNAHSLMTTGIKTVSAIQDYAGIGREIIKALQCFGEQPVKVFVPYRLELS
jgi:DNA-binding transcriptional regulator YhcF (GntR family)